MLLHLLFWDQALYSRQGFKIGSSFKLLFSRKVKLLFLFDKVSLYFSLALQSRSSCLSFQNFGITASRHHTCLMLFLFNFLPLKITDLGLERWFSSKEHWLLYQRTGVQFPASTWQFTIVCNSRSNGSNIFIQAYMEAKHQCTLKKIKQSNKNPN